MKITCIIGSAAFAASLACSGAWAWDQDPSAQYFERKDTIVSGAGDARDVNAATHVIDPWPRYVGNRQIPANGDRMSRAVERYREGYVWSTGAVRLRRYLISETADAYSSGRQGLRPQHRHGTRWRRCRGAGVGAVGGDAEANRLRLGFDP